MLNNKGVTLIEMIVALVIMGMIGYGFQTMLIGQLKISKKIETKLKIATDNAIAASKMPNTVNSTVVNLAVAPGADQRTYLPTLNQCVKLGGGTNATTQWYAKRQDARVIGFYKNSFNCTNGYIGTLTALTNPTYDDDVTNTFWNVSGDGSTLRVLVHLLNLPK